MSFLQSCELVRESCSIYSICCKLASLAAYNKTRSSQDLPTCVVSMLALSELTVVYASISNSFLRAIFPPRCISDIMIWLWIALASSAGSSHEQNVSTFNFFILNNQSSEEAGMWSEGWDRLLLNNRWGYLFWEQLREASIIFFCSLLCSYYHDTGCCCWIINKVIYSASAGS